MPRSCRLLAMLLLIGLGTATVQGQTSYPIIARIEPTAVQRGTTVDLTLSGAGDFSGATGLLVEGLGVSGQSVSAAKVDPPETKSKGAMKRSTTKSAKVKLSVEKTAAAVNRELRLVTPQGVSSVGLVVITEDPVVSESNDKANNDAKAAQEIRLPIAVSGTIGSIEDVDWYKFEAEKNRTITFALWGNRLENKIHDLQTHLDPILILCNAEGREIASDDNHDYADPLLVHTFKSAGTYRLQVRDTNYSGNANWTYVLLASTRPYVTSAFPIAVNPGKTSVLKGQGANFDLAKPISVNVPSTTPDGVQWLATETNNGSSQAFPIEVTHLPIVIEADDAGDETAKAQPVTLPAAINGRLGERNDGDAYRFVAKKGVVYSFEVVARRARSSADTVLRILDDKGNVAVEVDDTPGLGKDVRVEWTSPRDGAFAVQIGDLHSRGGPEFGYVILAEPAKPDFIATCDPDKINIGPGGRNAVFVKVVRRSGFVGPVTVSFSSLPPSVSASPLTIPANMTQGVIVVSAGADAKPIGTFVTLQAKGESTDGPIIRPVEPVQEIYLPGGGRGLYPVGTIALAVMAPSDIAVEASPTDIVLKPGATTIIDVTVKRRPDYDQGVNLAVNLAHLGQVFASSLPPGVTMKEAGSKTLLGPKETTGKIILQASPDAAACDKVPIVVMGHVSINFVVKTAYSSAPISITIPSKEKTPTAKKP